MVAVTSLCWFDPALIIWNRIRRNALALTQQTKRANSAQQTSHVLHATLVDCYYFPSLIQPSTSLVCQWNWQIRHVICTGEGLEDGADAENGQLEISSSDEEAEAEEPMDQWLEWSTGGNYSALHRSLQLGVIQSPETVYCLEQGWGVCRHVSLMFYSSQGLVSRLKTGFWPQLNFSGQCQRLLKALCETSV